MIWILLVSCVAWFLVGVICIQDTDPPETLGACAFCFLLGGPGLFTMALVFLAIEKSDGWLGKVRGKYHDLNNPKK